MFTPRRNPCFDVLPHFHHRQSISDKQRKLRTWLESGTVTAPSRTIPDIPAIVFKHLHASGAFRTKLAPLLMLAPVLQYVLVSVAFGSLSLYLPEPRADFRSHFRGECEFPHSNQLVQRAVQAIYKDRGRKWSPVAVYSCSRNTCP
jgi:hypothetical protein